MDTNGALRKKIKPVYIVIIALLVVALVASAFIVPYMIKRSKIADVATGFMTGLFEYDYDEYSQYVHPNVKTEYTEEWDYGLIVSVDECKLKKLEFCEFDELGIICQEFLLEKSVEAEQFALAHIEIKRFSDPENPAKYTLVLCEYEGEWKVAY